MSQEFDAIYERGVFRPLDRVNLPEQTKVHLQIQEAAEGAPAPLADEGSAQSDVAPCSPPERRVAGNRVTCRSWIAEFCLAGFPVRGIRPLDPQVSGRNGEEMLAIDLGLSKKVQ